MSEMNSDKEISNESLAAPSSQNSSTLTQTSRLNKNDDQNKQRKAVKLQIKKRSASKLCGYSERHFRRIVDSKTLQDCQFVKEKAETSKLEKPPKDENVSKEQPVIFEKRKKCVTDTFSSPESDIISSSESINEQSLPVNPGEVNSEDDDFFHSDESSDGSLIDNSCSESECDLSDDDVVENSFDNEEDTEDDNKDTKTSILFKKLRFWALTFRITLVALTALLFIFRSFTEQVNLPLDARTLLGTDKYTTIYDINGGEYLHLGLERAIRSIIRENKKKGVTTTHVKLAVNIDGVPIYSSSAKGLWLIVCSEMNSKDVYPVGVFFDRDKPKDANEFLKQFVDEAIPIINYGLRDENVTVSFEILVCDTPAKALVLYLKGHTGYDSCPKCNIKGTYVINKKKTKNSRQTGQVCFPGTGPFTLKTDDYTSESDVKPILTNIPGFGYVSSVPLDYMHLILLGVMKKLITLWILGPLKVRLSAEEVNKISKMLLKLRCSVPSEFARKPRLLSDFKFWKATEFRSFLLYTGPIVLKKIFLLKKKPEIYSHFLLLHSATTILVNEDLALIPSNIDYADQLLNQFVKDFPSVYAERYVSQNVHNLLHICSDVKRFGTLDKFSSFRFENYFSSIKKMIRKGEKPLEQIARRYGELEKASIESMEIPETWPLSSKMVLQEEHYNGPLTDEIPFGVHQFKVFKTETLNLNCNNSKNSCVLLDDGNFAVINNIVKQRSGKICFIGKVYLPIDKLYDNPDSSLFNIHYAQNNTSKNQSIHVENIVTKAWKVPCRRGIIVLPLAHNL